MELSCRNSGVIQGFIRFSGVFISYAAELKGGISQGE